MFKFSNLTIRAAIANQNGAMGADTISKNEQKSKSHTSRRQFLSYCFIAIFVVAAAFTSCGGRSGSGSGGGKSSAKIMMTTEVDGKFVVSLCGSGVATVDWGDGSEKVSLTLIEDENIYGISFEHTYPSASIRTVTINGDNITMVKCWDVTSLDVSKNKELTRLWASGQLTSLDVSKNTALTILSVSGPQFKSLDVSKNMELTLLQCSYAQLSATALNALFNTLHSNTVPPPRDGISPKTIYITNNPGSNDCDRSIAERKGWTFSNY